MFNVVEVCSLGVLPRASTPAPGPSAQSGRCTVVPSGFMQSSGAWQIPSNPEYRKGSRLQGMLPTKYYERMHVAQLRLKLLPGPENTCLTALLLVLIMVGSSYASTLPRAVSDNSGSSVDVDCSTTACKAAVPASGPFLQLRSTNINFLEQAYQAILAERAPYNVSHTLHEFEQLLKWLVLCTSSPQGSTGTANCAAAESTQANKSQAQQLIVGQVNMELLQSIIHVARDNTTRKDMTPLLLRIGGHLMHVPGTHSFPALRRLIVGALIKQRSVHGPFTGMQRVLADALVLQLYLMHRRASAVKGAIQYFHVSKSGGTNMCQTAGDNGCLAEGFDESSNCKVRAFLDWPRWLTRTGHEQLATAMQAMHGNHSIAQPAAQGSPSASKLAHLPGKRGDAGSSEPGTEYTRLRRGHTRALARRPLLANKHPWFINFEHKQQLMDCAHRATYLQRRGFNFYAVEYAMPRGSPCEQFLQLMLWRHPMDRMRSHIHYVQTLYAHTYKLQGVEALFEGRNSSFWRTFLPVGTDNQYIRSLLGAGMWQLPLKPITQQHTHAAMLQVLQQDVLLILEQRNFTEIACLQGLGWRTALRTQKVRASGTFRAQLYLPEDWNDMHALNEPDMQVYNFASQLAAIDAVVWHSAQLMRKELELDASLPANSECGYVSLPIETAQPASASGGNTAEGS